MRLEYLSFGTVRGAKEKGLGLVCCSPVTLCNCEMASNNDLSPERDEEKCKKRDRNFKGRICRRETEGRGER